MEATELLEILSRREDTKNQFKKNFTNLDALAAEMTAFSNTEGGRIFVGVKNDGTISGLSGEDVDRLNQLISNAASQSVRPPVNPITENVKVSDKLVIVVNIPKGLNKPYMDNNGAIWVKSGSDKRKVTAREEIQRIFQDAHLLYADERTITGTSVADLDIDYFAKFFKKQFDEELDDQNYSLTRLLENMRLLKNGQLNLSSLLLFGKEPYYRLPVFVVRAISYPGNDIHVIEYRDSEDIVGNLETMFSRTINFIMRNLRRLQQGQSVNSIGILEVPKITLEELVVNSLIHRDYFISAPVRVFIFDNRIEMISPGSLPNNLTIENIKRGNSTIRNPILASFAAKILPYRGLGNGIPRALREYPHIEFEDDRDANQFKVIIQRPTS